MDDTPSLDTIRNHLQQALQAVDELSRLTRSSPSPLDATDPEITDESDFEGRSR